jgi:hypothetical protein
VNIFQKDALETAERENGSGIISAWVTFKAALEDLLADYNAGPRGAKFPAKIQPTESDTLMVISCNKGAPASDPFYHIMVRTSGRMAARDACIDGTIEHWRIAGPIPPLKESEKKMSFALDRDGVPLRFRGTLITPYAAAEALLGEALLP